MFDQHQRRGPDGKWVPAGGGITHTIGHIARHPLTQTALAVALPLGIAAGSRYLGLRPGMTAKVAAGVLPALPVAVAAGHATYRQQSAASRTRRPAAIERPRHA